MSENYFNKYLDSRGGINGHKVVYTALDEADSASTAAQVGARAVDQLNVDAMVGGYGAFECTANARLFQQSHVYDLGGPEADIECWKSPNTRPMNTGPWVLYAMQINYFAKTDHMKNICLLESTSTPTSLADAQNVINVMDKVDHVQVYGIPYAAGTPITPVASAAVSHGCTGFVASGTEPIQVSLQQALASLNAFPKMKVITGVVYATQPAEMGPEGNGYLALSGVMPYWSTSNATLRLFHTLATRYNVPEDSFSEYGLLSDELFTEVVSHIKGPLNRTTIGNALKHMNGESGEGLEANNISWGTVDTSGRLLEVRNGQWLQLVNHWFTMDLTHAQLKSVETGVPLS